MTLEVYLRITLAVCGKVYGKVYLIVNTAKFGKVHGDFRSLPENHLSLAVCGKVHCKVYLRGLLQSPQHSLARSMVTGFQSGSAVF